ELEKEKTKEDQKNNENAKNQSCVRIYGIQVPCSSPGSESDSNSVNDTVPPPPKRSRCKTSIRSQLPPFNKKSKIYQSFTDPKYFDVILVSSDQIEIPTYRCVLAAFSTKFSKQFEKLRIHPARIQVKEFDASTIKDAIDFMFDRLISVFGKEVSLLKFAAAYGIQDLMEKCCEFIENLGENYLSSSNADLCQYIEIAYAHN
uniref:BTB domain-containing protein n=1 Tax=Panagrolaimus sp. ES5 TaxID=591445 RepID=A0AC34GJY1_9BILA